MATLTDLINRVRLELGDQPSQFSTTLTGDGSTKDFYVRVKPIEAAYLVVTTTVGTSTSTVGTTAAMVVRSTVGTTTTTLAQGTDFTVEDDLGMLHFTTAPASGATVSVSGTHYRYFTNRDIITFINTAVGQHIYNRTDSYGRQMSMAILPQVEEYPVALLATIEGLWALATDSAFDINIQAPDGVVIPRSQRYAQLTGIINARRMQYYELCTMLNIGVTRIEMGTLRRVSRTTNKLIPVYMPQEIDDSRKPERVYLQNDLMGRTPVPSTAAIYDIIMTQGDSWSAVFDFPNTLNLDEYIIKAQVRTYPESPTLIASFNVSVTSTADSQVTLALTPSQTKNFPLKAYWDIQLSKETSGVVTFEQTYVKGLVFTDRQVTTDGTIGPGTTNIHASVRTVSTYNISLSGLQTIDGITLAEGDRVLVNGQTSAAYNGVYIASSGAWSRASDANTVAELVPGFTVFVDKGATTYGETGWVMTGNVLVTIDVSTVTFVMTIQRGWDRN